MLNFKTYLIEYLTDAQRERFGNQYKMLSKARRDTNPFFGAGNDEIHGEIQNDDKSETHTRLENHLGKTLSHEEYKAGTTQDKYGRDVKLGRMIKDEKLRNEFNDDPSRKLNQTPHKTKTVRGLEVMGQTNSSPNAEHPKGHSWGNDSCKNVDTGMNRHYLPQEVAHGTVVHFVHDHNGQEIYRATLQPHHNKTGKVAYAVDAEYGIKHPKFTADAHRVAAKLSGEVKGNPIHEKNPHVYDDNGESVIVHPNVQNKQIERIIKNGHWTERQAVAKHPNLNSNHLSALLKDDDSDVAATALEHPNITSDHITQALNSNHEFIQMKAVGHPKATQEHIKTGLTHSDSNMRRAAIENPNTPSDLLSHMQHDPVVGIRRAVAQHPRATSEQLDTALRDHHFSVRQAVLRNPHIQLRHLDKLVNDDDDDVVHAASYHPKLTADHITTIMKGDNVNAQQQALDHENANSSHIDQALKKGDNDLSFAVSRRHSLLTPDHLRALSKHREWRVRRNVARHPKTDPDTLKSLAKDKDGDVAAAARSSLDRLE